MVEEPNFNNEKELEDAIAAVAQSSIEATGDHAIVLRGFGLDLAVFTKRNGTQTVHLFEVKAFSEHHGRCGFGHQRGDGNQIRLLYDADRGEPRSTSELETFDQAIRWVLGNRSQAAGSARFLIFTCRQAQAAAVGGVRPGKQNNFRLSTFDGLWITWQVLVKQVDEFLRAVS